MTFERKRDIGANRISANRIGANRIGDDQRPRAPGRLQAACRPPRLHCAKAGASVLSGVVLAVATICVFAAPSARADVLSEMQRFWDGAAVNTTGPTAFEGQASGHWTLGNLYVRAPVQSERIATVNLPSFRAGCGGIDAFAGSFSFIDSDQLVAFARGIAQNATGFAFELALETISPVIAETMSKLRALANWVNNQSINS